MTDIEIDERLNILLLELQSIWQQNIVPPPVNVFGNGIRSTQVVALLRLLVAKGVL